MRPAVLLVLSVSSITGCAPESSSDLDEMHAAVRVCPDAETVPGIDVSFYQGTIDWTQVSASGIAFAFARVSDGLDHVDPEFDANWGGIRAAGLIRGAYQYFEPGEDAIAQANLVADKVGVLGPSDLPVVIDVEATGGEPPSSIADAVGTWITRVAAKTGKPPIIYTAKYFWDGDVAKAASDGRPLWVADYGASCPDLPDAWPGWLFWQYGYRADIDGISTNVDVDWFNGSREALERAAGLSPEAAPGGDKTVTDSADASHVDGRSPCSE